MSGGIVRRLLVAIAALWPTLAAARQAESVPSREVKVDERPPRLSYEESCRRLQALGLLEVGVTGHANANARH